MVDAYLLWNFALDGLGKWKDGDWLCKFQRGMMCDRKRGFMVRSLYFQKQVIVNKKKKPSTHCICF
jgi:hypothetical protein